MFVSQPTGFKHLFQFYAVNNMHFAIFNTEL